MEFLNLEVIEWTCRNCNFLVTTKKIYIIRLLVTISFVKRFLMLYVEGIFILLTSSCMKFHSGPLLEQFERLVPFVKMFWIIIIHCLNWNYCWSSSNLDSVGKCWKCNLKLLLEFSFGLIIILLSHPIFVSLEYLGRFCMIGFLLLCTLFRDFDDVIDGVKL